MGRILGLGLGTHSLEHFEVWGRILAHFWVWGRILGHFSGGLGTHSGSLWGLTHSVALWVCGRILVHSRVWGRILGQFGVWGRILTHFRDAFCGTPGLGTHSVTL